MDCSIPEFLETCFNISLQDEAKMLSGIFGYKNKYQKIEL
jgi:hypothetical protein